MRGILWAVVVTVLVVSAPAGAGVARFGHDDPHGRRVEREAGALISRAERQVNDAHPRCAPRFPTRRARVVHRAPSSDLLHVLAPLRRPATAEDRAALHSERFFPFASRVYIDYVRVVHTADGHALTLTPIRPVARPRVPRACHALYRARILGLGRAASSELRGAAVRIEDQVNRSERPDRAHVSPDGVLLDGPDGGGGGAGASFLRRYGQFGSSGGVSVNGGPGSIVTGLLPDGVVSVTSTFPRKLSRGLYRNPKVYPSTVTITAPVHESVVRFAVPRPAEDAFAARMVWRDATGKIVRIVHPPGD